MSTVKSRLSEFLAHEGISQKKFSDMVGVSKGFVANIRVSIQPKTTKKIAEAFPNLNISWLLTGDGEMLIPQGESDVMPLTKGLVDNGRVVPIFNLDVVGGFFSPTEDSEWVIARQFFPKAAEGDFAVYVSGNSMEPVLPQGTPVLLREVSVNGDIEWNTPYVVVTKDYANRYIKLLKPDPNSDDDMDILLVSYNPDYKPRKFSLLNVGRLFKVISASLTF